VDYKAEVTTALDMESLFSDLVKVKAKSSDGKELQALCPFHDDKKPSLSLNIKSGLWNCHACGATGSVFDLYSRLKNVDFLTALKELAGLAGVYIPSKALKRPIPMELVEEYHKRLLDSVYLEKLMDTRGILRDTVIKYRIGWETKTGRYTIPVFDASGECINIRRYKMGAKANKMLSYVAPDGTRYGEAKLFNIDVILNNKEILFTEGELDAILASQYGFNAFTCTSGAGTFFASWLKYFQDKVVFVIFDNDATGRAGAVKVAMYLKRVCERVYIVNLPESIGPGGDITDYFTNFGYTKEELRELLDKAVPFEPLIDREEVKAKPVTLSESSLAKNSGKRIGINIMVSGKDMAPYLIPGEFIVHCPQGIKKCTTCALSAAGGERYFKLSAKTPEIMELVAVPKEQQTMAIKRLAGVSRCDRVGISIEKKINLEEVRLIPQLTFSTEENEYVACMAYHIGHGIKANRNYYVEGYVWPEPKKEYATLAFNNVVPAQDNIETFRMTPEMHKQLEIFQVDDKKIGAKLDEIYTDLERNVTHIWGRKDLMLALDLAYHSMLSFNFQGERVQKGWMTALALGDSGCGKTALTNSLIEHYRLGERVSGENATEAGLIGALSQIGGSHWVLSWGKLVLNDRRLVVVDEFGGLPKEVIAKFSDMFSTGVAALTKVRTEQTYARTRLFFMSNTREGRQLNTYASGIEALRTLIPKNEDIRRLDFALTVASGEVPVDEINKPLDSVPKVEHIYTSERCKWLILWAWSRQPHQVFFEEAAIWEILRVAKGMGEIYSSQIPLVEPSDQRFKIARLAVALAARLFSTDDGEHIIVTANHVRYIEMYLNAIYSKSSMSYDVFSRSARKSSELSSSDRARLLIEFGRLPDYAELAAVLMDNQTFKKQDIIDQMGYDKESVADIYKFLSRNRLIKNLGSRGYCKTPNLITILKEIVQQETEREAENGGDKEYSGYVL
jgi:hypothetical protein